jgi:hypothetical protein
MSNTTEIMKQLQKPFPSDEIEFRVQSCGVSNGKPWAMVLAYVQARAIQRRLDDVFGWDGWTDEYRSTDNNMICRLGVRTEQGWIYKENGASETQVEAFKGGISAAFKRVAASGYGIGRYLYDLTESFAECTMDKPKNMNGWNKAKTKDNKMIYWKTPILPEWALPELTVGEVLKQWTEAGGTEEQFDATIQKNWKITRDKLQQNHLVGIVALLSKRKAS